MSKLDFSITPDQVYASLDAVHAIKTDFMIQIAKKNADPLMVKQICIRFPLGTEWTDLSPDGTLPPPVPHSDSSPDWQIALSGKNIVMITPNSPSPNGQAFTKPVGFRLPGLTIGRGEGDARVNVEVDPPSATDVQHITIRKLANDADQVSFYADPPDVRDVGDETTLHIKGPREYKYRPHIKETKPEGMLTCDHESGGDAQECELAVTYPIEKDTEFELDVLGEPAPGVEQLLNTLPLMDPSTKSPQPVKLLRPTLSMANAGGAIRLCNGQTVRLKWTSSNADSVSVSLDGQVISDTAPLETDAGGFVAPVVRPEGGDATLSVTAYSPRKTVSAQQPIALTVVEPFISYVGPFRSLVRTFPQLLPLADKKQALVVHWTGLSLLDLSDLSGRPPLEVWNPDSVIGDTDQDRMLAGLPAAVSSDGRFLMVYARETKRTMLLELGGQKPRQLTDIEGRVIAAAPDGAFYVLTNEGTAPDLPHLRKYDPVTLDFLPEPGGRPLKIPAPDWRTNYPVTPDGRYLIITAGQNLTIIDLTENAVARTTILPIPHDGGITVTPDGTEAWLCFTFNSVIGVVDIATGVLDQNGIRVSGARDVAFTHDGRRALACGDLRVTAIDVARRVTLEKLSLRRCALGERHRHSPGWACSGPLGVPKRTVCRVP